MDETTSTETSQPNQSKGFNFVVVVVVLVVLGVAGWKLIGGYKMAGTPSTPSVSTPTASKIASSSPTPASEAVPTVDAKGVKNFQITEGSFYFNPNIIRVKMGDRVKITLSATDAQHDFVIDELGVKSATTKSGNTDTVEFTANKTGTFEFYCAIGQHRQNGMVGKLIVE